jgi:ADP-ribose pyrophosphatase
MSEKKEVVIINFRVAVKAFIVRGNEVFLMKRESNDIQAPSIWEIPGGRLELGEDPIIGLMREIREETGLYVEVIYPMSVRHFTRDDGQIITMLIFLCKPKGGYLKLSDEHSEYSWIDIDNAKEKISDFFFKEIDLFNKLNLGRLV